MFLLFLFFILTQSEHCIPGTNGCIKCETNQNDGCKFCEAGYGYNSTTKTCEICSSGYYSNGGQKQCESCNSYSYCSEMNEEERDWKCPFYSINEGSSFCEYCPPGKFTHIEHNECFDCPENCLYCKGGSKAGECIHCYRGYGLEDNYNECEDCSSLGFASNDYGSDGFTKCVYSHQNGYNSRFELTSSDNPNAYYLNYIKDSQGNSVDLGNIDNCNPPTQLSYDENDVVFKTIKRLHITILKKNVFQKITIPINMKPLVIKIVYHQ